MAAMDDDVDAHGAGDASVPVWAVFGDLMAGLLGAFVLILLFALALQVDLSTRLKQEVAQREAAEKQRQTLEQALAVPLATGRITLVGGRIGISGNVLFAFNSADLQPEGEQLLKSLAAPLKAYLQGRQEILMVSGFTDDRTMRGGPGKFSDNWELSAQRSLTVTRALIDAGMPSSLLFAAAFGSEQPVASNADADGRARNRRVELAPTPKPKASANSDGSARR